MLIENFQAICGSTPDALAVVSGADRLSYGELDRRSTAMARQLAVAGLAQGALVAIHLPRNAATILSMLAILKCGAAYTVVEDDGIVDEHRNRLLQIHPDLVICEDSRALALSEAGLRVASVDALDRAPSKAVPLPTIVPEDVAYVLFTSGSTGKPKGVSVTHGNVAHYTAGIQEALDVREPMRYAHVSTLAADLGNTSLLLSLATGGCLYLVDAHLRKDPITLRDYLIEHSIDFIKITPTHWNAITSNLGQDGLKNLRLRRLVLGGEALTVAFARKIFESGAVELLSNHYGPTETTVGVTAYPMRSAAELDAITSECVPIGRPLAQTRLRVRDEEGRIHSRAASGELFIGGPSVSAGYRNEPALTEAAFQQLQGEDGRFYKTGDFVSLDDNGVALFLGRIDRQVKVNGYRVELEHVESVMRTLPAVEEAAVYFIDVHGKRRLVAAVTTRDGADVAAVRPQLEQALPDHMVPKVILRMDALPRNANGKIDMKALEAQVVRLANEAPAGGGEDDAAFEATSPLHAEIRAAWRRYINVAGFGEDESFFDLGGDSLDAIELIADLQLKGHAVTAHAFLSHPTINGLVAAIAHARTAPAVVRSTADLSRKLSPAQSFFLRQHLENADHHNQALLLQANSKLDVEVMHKAITHLVNRHPALRTAFAQDAEGFRTELVDDEADDAFDMVLVRKENDEDAVRRRIDTVSQQVHESMSLADGHLFKARLFKFDTRPDMLLLVAHHIAVDVISWRILVGELSKLYHDLASGQEIAEPMQSSSFPEWVAHLDEHWDALLERGGDWLASASALEQHVAADKDEENTEGQASTLWLGYSKEQTQTLLAGLHARGHLPLHVALLAAFAHAHAQQAGTQTLVVDVESHGRVTLDDTIDISRVVGWHTSTYPVALNDTGASLDQAIAEANAALARAPDLGVIYGVKEKRDGLAQSKVSAPICYNYLGTIDFAHDTPLVLSPASLSIGRGRGPDNHRGHALKLSGRIIDGRLIIDLSFPRSAEAEQVHAAMEGLDRELRQLGGLASSATGANLFLEPGTRTGLVTYAPKTLIEAAETVRRDYRAVLFTGATGFVGVHVLHELVKRTDARIYCLVRGTAKATPAQRLRESCEFYFPADADRMLADRIEAIEGDVSALRFGLDQATYDNLAAKTDAIYHFAADTRLFGREEEFERANVFSAQQCIDFAKAVRLKDFHYMSTLAVCGVNNRGGVIEFSEDCADVGQEFQNHYEATKYRAECLVQEFRADGGQGFIYRSGNVSGHSRTARFQRNAKDNRFIQFLSACVKTGMLPQQYDEPLVLSPIDEVAAGIAAISLDAATTGGVFHVDSMSPVRVKQVFDALRKSGIKFEQSEHASFATLFSDLCDRDRGNAAERDPELSLGLFWAMRKPRNISFNNSNTHELMARLRCSFSDLDEQWVHRFVRGLVDEGVFVRGVQNHAAARATSDRLDRVA